MKSRLAQNYLTYGGVGEFVHNHRNPITMLFGQDAPMCVAIMLGCLRDNALRCRTSKALISQLPESHR